MTLLLVNESKNSAISLRYGEGLNKLLQINPTQTIECPSDLRRNLLQHYLSTFKDLRLIDDSKSVEIKEQKNVQESNSTSTQVSKEENETKDGEESNNNALSNGEDSEDGEDGSDQGTEINNEKKETIVYDEKSLTKLSAGEVKNIAISLGIEVTTESTKKALIPIILNKQRNE